VTMNLGRPLFIPERQDQEGGVAKKNNHSGQRWCTTGTDDKLLMIGIWTTETPASTHEQRRGIIRGSCAADGLTRLIQPFSNLHASHIRSNRQRN